MEGFRVFTWNHNSFPQLSFLADTLKNKGIRLVAILDPGIKLDPDYSVYADGLGHGRGFAAFDADGGEFRYEFRFGQQGRRNRKRFSPEIGIEASDDDPFAFVSQLIAEVDDCEVQE